MWDVQGSGSRGCGWWRKSCLCGGECALVLCALVTCCACYNVVTTYPSL